MTFLNFTLPAFLLVPSTEKYEREQQCLSHLHARYHKIQKSEDFLRYKRLNDYVSSPDYKRDLNQIRTLQYHRSKEEKMERRAAELRKYPEVRHYRKTGDADSGYVKEYINLQEHIHTPSFKKHKAYLKNKKRHRQSEPYQKFLEYKRLSGSDNIKAYFHLHKKYKDLFDKMDQTKTLFEDEFCGNELNRHWSSIPLQCEHTFQQAYSQNEELHCVTPGNNIEQQGGVMHIYTRRENAEGMAWDKNAGFIPRRYQYTSGVLTTGTYLQICTGALEVRVRFPNVKNVYHSCWLGSKRRLPFVIGFTYCNKTLEMGVYGEDGTSSSKRKKISFNANTYYVFRLEFTSQHIVWSINGKRIFKSRHPLKNALSLGFSSGVVGQTDNETLPASFEIDRIRVFKSPLQQ
jgi:hypothetical protein